MKRLAMLCMAALLLGACEDATDPVAIRDALLFEAHDLNEVGSELVVNGSFEQPTVPSGWFGLAPNFFGFSPPAFRVVTLTSVPGWTLFKGKDIEIQNNIAGSPGVGFGDQFLELDATGGWLGSQSSGVFQDVPTGGGGCFRLSFAFSPRPFRPAEDNILRVGFAGQTVVTLGPVAGGSDTNWQLFEFFLRGGPGSTTRLEFDDLGTPNGLGTYVDVVSVVAVDAAACGIVDIDIKPGSDPNCINKDSKGLTAVAILASEDFDPSQVDPVSVQLEGVSALRWSLNKDVNEDGLNDLVLHFSTEELNATGELYDGNTLELTGALLDGTPIAGSDVVYLAGGPTCLD